MTDKQKLKPCRACGAECLVSDFGNTENMPVPVYLWICSNANIYGGDCPDCEAYLSEEAWNTRTPAATADREGLVGELEDLDSSATPGPFYTLDSPWLASDAQTAILAESPDPHVARYICDFDLCMLDEEDRKSEYGWEDAKLLVWLRNHVPEILTALRTSDRDAVIDECINAAIKAKLPYERQSAGRDDSGINLTLQRQRGWTVDALKALKGAKP